MIKFLDSFKRICFDGTDGNDGGGSGGGGNEGIEVPEYINSYVSTIEDEEQKEYMSGLLKDEKGINVLKNFIKDPNAEWEIKAENYSELNQDEIGEFLSVAKEKGWSEEYTRTQLEGRKEYLTTERELMTPEMRSLDATINNFIATVGNEAEKSVYARLAENSIGRKILVEKILNGKGNTTLPPGNGNSSNINIEEWKSKYDDAIESGDIKTKENLKREALASGEEYFKIFFNGKVGGN